MRKSHSNLINANAIKIEGLKHAAQGVTYISEEFLKFGAQLKSTLDDATKLIYQRKTDFYKEKFRTAATLTGTVPQTTLDTSLIPKGEFSKIKNAILRKQDRISEINQQNKKPSDIKSDAPRPKQGRM